MTRGAGVSTSASWARTVAGATGTTMSSSMPRHRRAFIEGRGEGGEASATSTESSVTQSGQGGRPDERASAASLWSTYAGISAPTRWAQAIFALSGWHWQVVQHALGEAHPHIPPAHG